MDILGYPWSFFHGWSQNVIVCPNTVFFTHYIFAAPFVVVACCYTKTSNNPLLVVQKFKFFTSVHRGARHSMALGVNMSIHEPCTGLYWADWICLVMLGNGLDMSGLRLWALWGDIMRPWWHMVAPRITEEPFIVENFILGNSWEPQCTSCCVTLQDCWSQAMSSHAPRRSIESRISTVIC